MPAASLALPSGDSQLATALCASAFTGPNPASWFVWVFRLVTDSSYTSGRSVCSPDVSLRDRASVPSQARPAPSGHYAGDSQSHPVLPSSLFLSAFTADLSHPAGPWGPPIPRVQSSVPAGRSRTRGSVQGLTHPRTLPSLPWSLPLSSWPSASPRRTLCQPWSAVPSRGPAAPSLTQHGVRL